MDAKMIILGPEYVYFFKNLNDMSLERVLINTSIALGLVLSVVLTVEVRRA